MAAALNWFFTGKFLNGAKQEAGFFKVNIWGAEFDSQGEITYLYITDNNDTDLENNLDNGTLTKAGMIRKPIQIRDGIPFMESSVPGCFTIQILELNFMGLKKAEWKKYFQNFFC